MPNLIERIMGTKPETESDPHTLDVLREADELQIPRNHQVVTSALAARSSVQHAIIRLARERGRAPDVQFYAELRGDYDAPARMTAATAKAKTEAEQAAERAARLEAEQAEVCAIWKNHHITIERCAVEVDDCQMALAATRGAAMSPEHIETVADCFGQWSQMHFSTVADGVAAVRARVGILEETLAVLKKRHANACAAVVAFAKTHSIPASQYPPGLAEFLKSKIA